MTSVILPVLRHRVMQTLDQGEDLAGALYSVTSFEDLQRVHEMSTRWSEDVQRMADQMGIVGPPDVPVLDLWSQSRREIVMTLLADTKRRIAWLTQHSNLPGSLDHTDAETDFALLRGRNDQAASS